MRDRGRAVVGVVGILGVWLGLHAAAGAQGEPTIRLALLSQWTVNQQRGALGPAFSTVLDQGVVDRVVFSWQPQVIERSSLVWKPVWVLGGSEAERVGGRGEFQLKAVRPSSAAAAWADAELAPVTNRPDDVAVVAIGGETGSIRQVLATLFIAGPGGAFTELPLVLRALLSRPGVPVLRLPDGQPLPAGLTQTFYRGPAGLEFLVVRSQVETWVDGAYTPNGRADAAASQGHGSGDWRYGDRVFVRVPLSALRAGTPGIVLVWKDRVLRSDGDGPCGSNALC